MNEPTAIFDATRLRTLMERDGLDLMLAASRPNVGYLSNWITHHWTWDWPFWFEMDKEYDGEDAGVVTEDGFDPFTTLTTDLDALARG